jgi:hypothetical protein
MEQNNEQPKELTRSFNPETRQILSLAVQDACDRIRRSGSTYAEPFYARIVRAILVRRINKNLLSGEKDVRRLSDDAILFLTQTYKE